MPYNENDTTQHGGQNASAHPAGGAHLAHSDAGHTINQRLTQRVPAIGGTEAHPGAASDHAPEETESPADRTVVSPRVPQGQTDPREDTAPQRVAPGNAAAPAYIPGQNSTHTYVEGDKPNRGSNPKRSLAITAGVICGLLVAAYAGGVFFFSNFYYPGTSIAGVDVSLADKNSAVTRIEREIRNYSLTVEGNGFSWTYQPEEGTLTVDAEAEASAVLSQNDSLAWPARLAASLTGGDDAAQLVGLSPTYDQEDFQQQLSDAVDEFNADRTGTFDAAGAYDESAGKFTVEKARASQRLNKDAVLAAATKGIDELATTAQIDDSAYEELAGGATDEQLQEACDKANEIIGVNVDLTYGGTEVATLDGKQMTEWITFDDDLNPKLDDDALADWISELAKTKLDTVGTERTYTRGDGEKITIGGGNYGWNSNEAELAELVQEAVANKQTGTIEIPTKQEAAVYKGMGERDWGAYVDIDISEQHVRYYDANDKLLWESDCITGNPNLGNETPTGIYELNNKETDTELTGKKDPETGEPEYISHVDYWMSFIGGAVGLHDASWQADSSFSNPKAYLSVGSHGCVNLPPKKAAELYKIIQLGDCVIVHE